MMSLLSLALGLFLPPSRVPQPQRLPALNLQHLTLREATSCSWDMNFALILGPSILPPPRLVLYLWMLKRALAVRDGSFWFP